MSLPRTPSQTVGPFFEFGMVTKPLLVDEDARRRDPHRGPACSTAPASRCRTASSRSGRPAATGATRKVTSGWGRCQTDADGGYAFTTVKPGAVSEPDGTTLAPHLTVLCFARGLLKPVLTRLYFSDEHEANEATPCCRRSRDAAERATLVATADRLRELPLRHPAAGRRADGLLHDARLRPVTFSRFDGPADAPVVVLSNSLGTTLEMWEPQVPALSERFGVLRYDHPGHGGSRDDTPVRSVEGLARGVLELLDQRGFQRVSFCGLSLGGAVGMWLAMHEPERIDRLVLACTSARFGSARTGWREPPRCARRRGGVADAVLAAVVHAAHAPRAARTRRRVPRDDGLGRAARAMPAAARRSATGIPVTR